MKPDSWFTRTSGVFGALFIATAILTVSRHGAAIVFALIVVDQLFGSMVLDHFGLFGLAQHSISSIRLAGAVFLLLGVVLIRA
ncbi:DMT family transporter [Acidovorax sp. SDU_ACID1]|uniref:DMT family transporter n=1 Tax=Acidovorax sp. SDU_ACID1 TaxID=3136632 RepID=UPI003872D18C